MFKPDQPIKSAKEDLLGRVSFSQAFGRALLSYKDKTSIVAALYGNWGSGKSSVLNLTLEYIEESTKEMNEEAMPIVFHFNPWNYSDQNLLVSQFFKALSFALRREDYGSQIKEAGEKLETYSSFFIPLALIPEPTISGLSLLFSKIIGGVGKAAKAFGDIRLKNLIVTKEELNRILEKQARKIIIVIDDIDRLNNIEIRQIFQLIKMLGDFPNTIYLLAFDRNVVINALAKVQEGSGEEYLEKIVQFPIELPPISKTELEKLLFSNIDEVIKDVPEERWDPMHWGNIYHSGMNQYFQNVRHVTRYINSLKFGFEMVRAEVNPVDFLGITCIQVFEPMLYDGIRDNKDVFSGLFYSSSDPDIKQSTKRCEEILDRATILHDEKLKDFLSRLFPKLKTYYKNTFFGHESIETSRLQGRVCHPDLFDTFFRLALPIGEIPDREMKAIISLADNRETFTQVLMKLNQEGRLLRFLERMEDYTKEFVPEGNIQNIISVIMDVGDAFPEEKAGMFDFDTPMRILRISYQLSHRFDSQEKRFIIFKAAISSAENSIYTIVHEVGVQGQQHGKGTSKQDLDPEDKRTVNSEQLEKLERLAVQKIETWAKDGRLSKHPHLISILYSWKRWITLDSNSLHEFVKNLLETEEGLVDFITAFLGKSISQGMGDYVGKINWRISLKRIEDFVPVSQIELRVRDIVSSNKYEKLTEQQKLALRTFVDTVEGKVKDRFPED